MLTKREIFDKVKTHLLAQNAKSTTCEGTMCLYRSENGLKCAIGCLIPDEDYVKEMDDSIECDPSNPSYNSHNTGIEINALVKNCLLKNGIDCGENLVFLQDLQRIHDRSDVKDWPSCLNKFEHDNFQTLTLPII